MAAVAADSALRDLFRTWGVKDSKAFGGPESGIPKRAALAEKIKAAARVEIEVVTPQDVDLLGIDEAERRAGRRLLRRLKVENWEKIVCDGKRIFGILARDFPRLEALDKADSLEITVSAASIMAKHRRDLEWARIRDLYEPEFGPLRGGGYPNRPTVKFLRSYFQSRGDLPPEARRSWGPCRDLLQGVLIPWA